MHLILRYLRNYKKECIIAPLFKLMEVVFELLVPYVVIRIVDESIPSGDRGLLVRSFLLLLALSLIGFSCTLIAQYFSANAAASNPPTRSIALTAPPIIARRPSLSKYSGPDEYFFSGGSAKSALFSLNLWMDSALGKMTGLLSMPLISAITRSSSSYCFLSSMFLSRKTQGTVFQPNAAEGRPFAFDYLSPAAGTSLYRWQTT